MITHSYIGQQPVYSEALRCHIYPTPDYKPPKFMKLIRTYKGEFKKESNKVRYPNGTYHGNREKVIAWLRENGPATCSVIAGAIGTRTRNIERCVCSSYNKMFCVVGVTDDEWGNCIYGLNGQTLADMKVDCRTILLHRTVADALRKLGQASAVELATTAGVNVRSVRFCLSSNKHLFTYTRISTTEYLWRLKEAA